MQIPRGAACGYHLSRFLFTRLSPDFMAPLKLTINAAINVTSIPFAGLQASGHLYRLSDCVAVPFACRNGNVSDKWILS